LGPGRLPAARAGAAADGRAAPREDEYQPACAEACPARAITFGDLDDPKSAVARLARDPRAFRLLERLGTDASVFYLSARPWVRALGRTVLERPEEEGGAHG
jgi:molybdopterin-containing oxidoreductase family iron-sulfur binding subunit